MTLQQNTSARVSSDNRDLCTGKRPAVFGLLCLYFKSFMLRSRMFSI